MKNLKKKPKLIIQFNEANFSLISEYANKYNLSGIKRILRSSTVINTSSENDYEKLEPWIQWYSFYSNLNYSDHKVFHLGDCLKSDHKLFTEDLALKGDTVGIFGSMNLRPFNKYKIYIPDAWTESHSDNSLSSKIISSTMKKIINKNVKLSLSVRDILGIIWLIGLPRSLYSLKMMFKSFIYFFKRSRAELASLFDYFFLNYCLKRSIKNKLDVSFIFLNGLAHVQHHYMLSSEFVEGNNPNWYISSKSDPLLNSIKIYDDLFKQLFKHYGEKNEIWVVTGLTQYPYKNPVIYWRFNNHKKILKHYLNFDFSIIPRMTRDFEIKIKDEKNTIDALDFLNKAKIISSEKTVKAFGFVDKQSSNTLFASFMYEGEEKDVDLTYNGKRISVKNEINFVAIKNGGHDNRGWVYGNIKKENIVTNTEIWNLSNIIFKDSNLDII